MPAKKASGKNDGSSDRAESARMQRAAANSKSAQAARQATAAINRARGAAWKQASKAGFTPKEFEGLWREAAKYKSGHYSATRSDWVGSVTNTGRRATGDIAAERAEMRARTNRRKK